MTQQPVQSNPSGSGIARNGVFMGRGGTGFRGRGGFGGRGGFNGAPAHNERRYAAVRNIGKDKDNVVVNKQQQSNKKNAMEEGTKKMKLSILPKEILKLVTGLMCLLMKMKMI